MAIGTYSELCESVASMLSRRDLTEQIPGYIALAEEWMKPLLVPFFANGSVDLTLAAGVNRVSVRALFSGDMMRVTQVSIAGEGTREILPLVTRAQLLEASVSTRPGRPRMWTFDGDWIIFQADADRAYRIIVSYDNFAALSEDNASNYVLSKYPGVYLFGALYYAAMKTRDSEAVAMYGAEREAALTRANRMERQKMAPLKDRRSEIALAMSGVSRRLTGGGNILTG